MNNPVKCYIYARVSTAMQVDGFRLEAQKDKLRKYAALNDIAAQTDGFSYVLVFKLSRFGRN